MDDEADFDVFYANYPRREARADARKAWRQTARRRPALDVVLAAIARQRVEHDWCRDRRRFIPLPATWLRAERWDDEFDVPESVLPALPALPAAAAGAGGRAPIDHAMLAAANAAWAEVRAANAQGQMQPLLGWSDPRTAAAVRVIAASLPDMGARNAHLVQREFVAAFQAVRLTPDVTANPNVVPLRRRA